MFVSGVGEDQNRVYIGLTFIKGGKTGLRNVSKNQYIAEYVKL